MIIVSAHFASTLALSDFLSLTDQLTLLNATLLDSENLLKSDALHIGLHGTEEEITSTCLECLVGLLTDQNLARWALRAHPSCLIDGGSDQTELGLSLPDNTSNDLTCVDADFYTQFFGVSKRLAVHVVLDAASEVSDAHRVMRSEQAIVNVFFDNFEAARRHISFTHRLYLLQTMLLA